MKSAGFGIFVVCLLCISGFIYPFITNNTEAVTVNGTRQSDEPKVFLYTHFTSDNIDVDHYLSCLEGDDQELEINDVSATMDVTLRFPLSPSLVGNVDIVQTSPTGDEPGFWIGGKIWMSSSKITDRLIRTVSIGTEDDPDKYGNSTADRAVSQNPSSAGITQRINFGTLTKEGNLVLTLRYQFTGLLTSFTMHAGPSYPSHINMYIRNDLEIDTTAKVDTINKTVVIEATHNNPFGDNNLNHSATLIAFSGPTYPVTLHHEDKSFVWKWSYTTDSAQEGDYTVQVTVVDLQDESATDTADFKISVDEPDDDDSTDGDETEAVSDPIFLAAVIILVIVVILVFFLRVRKRR